MIRTFTIAALLLGTATTAVAQKAPTEAQKKAEAKALYDKGINHYNLGEFDQAIFAFRAAYTLSSAPGLLFNIAQAFRLKKDYEQASYFYATYLRLKPDAPNKADVEARIAEMNSLLEEQKKIGNKAPIGTVPPEGGAATGTGGTPTGTTATTETPTGTTGTEPPTGTTGTTTTTTTTAEPTTTAALTSPTGPEGPTDEPPTGSSRPGRSMKMAGIAAIAGGGALLITGVVFGSMASSAESDLDKLNSGGGPWDQDAQDTYDRGKRNNSIAIVSLIVGGAAIVGGGALYFLGSKKDQDASVAVVPARGGATFAVGWKF